MPEYGTITYLEVLNACAHAGLVEKGKECFQCILEPSVEHYTCMVDLLGRSGLLNEALELAKGVSSSFKTWKTLLSASRKWKSVEVGKLAFGEILKIDSRDGAAYALMASIYSAAGMWEEYSRVQTMRRTSSAVKKPGQSWWTDSAGTVHRFVVGDTSHIQSEQIFKKLKEVMGKIYKEKEYTADLESVTRNIPSEEKEDSLCGHSERLAICCALVNTAPGTIIRIAKNLRVCLDCHHVTALISTLERRTVICRDSNRFHVFRDGACSCNNFW